MAKELSVEAKLSLITQLQRYRQEANANRNFKGVKGEIGKPYFRAYPENVRTIAWQHLSSLCIKHKAKLEANKSFMGTLVATATRLALDELGITQISRKGFHRLRVINRIRVDLGIRDKCPVDRLSTSEKRRRKIAKASASVQKLNVSQLPLEC